MEQKKDLAKIALAAFLFAAAAPAHAILDNGIEAQRTYLAAGCKAHGCESTTDNAKNKNDMYYTPSNTYQIKNQPSESAGQKTAEGSNPEEMKGGMNNFNRAYNTTTDYDYNRKTISTTAAATLTEAQLLGMLNTQTRNIYLNLDHEGKSLAIQLASQDSYKDKNLAIKEAQRRMNERSSQMNR